MLLSLSLCCVLAGQVPAADAGPLLVVAPHPDDEVLMAAGAIHDARRAGRPVTIVIVTTGGLGCERSPDVRQGESVAGLATLGVDEDSVLFLGYPDGHLHELGPTPLPPVLQRDASGACVPTSTTTAWRGRGHTDAHRQRTGHPAPFTADAVVDDLVAILRAVRPGTVIVSHEVDDHPDHARTGLWVRRALEQVGTPVTVWRSIVHHGPCWPRVNGADTTSDVDGDDDVDGAHDDCTAPPFQPTRPMPPLPGPWRRYTPSVRRPVDAALKLRSIAQHRSQTGPVVEADWLAAFARRDEVFFPLHLVPSTTAGLARAGAIAVAPGHVGLQLDRVPAGVVGSVADVVVDTRVVGTIHLDPHGGPPTLQADRHPADGGPIEITVRQGGRLVGVVVDPVGVSGLETPTGSVPP